MPAQLLGGAPQRVLALQQTIGNRALARLIEGTSGGGRRPPSDRGRILARDGPVATWSTPQPSSGILADAQAGRWADVAQAVLALPIEPLLDALEQLRDAQLLRAFRLQLDDMPIVRPPRFEAALLAITSLSTDYRLRGARARGDLTVAVADAIQERKEKWLRADTAADARAVMRWDRTAFGPWRGGGDTPTQCVEGQFDPGFANLTPEQWIKGFLDYYEFSPPPVRDSDGTSVLFNREFATVDALIDGAYEHFLYSIEHSWLPTFYDDHLFLDERLIERVVKQAYQDARAQAENRPFTLELSPQSATQVAVAFQLASAHAYHAGVGKTPSRWDPWGLAQGQVAVTFKLHYKDKPGVEIQGFAQLQLATDTSGSDQKYRLQQVVAGAQVAWVIPFLLFDEKATISFLWKFAAGAKNLGGQPGTQVQATDQTAGGAQLTVPIPGTNGHLSAVGTLTGGVTHVPGVDGHPSTTTVDVSPSLGLKYTF